MKSYHYKSWGFGTAQRKFVEICRVTHTHTHTHTDAEKFGLLLHTQPPQIFPRALLLMFYDRITPWLCVVPIKTLGVLKMSTFKLLQKKTAGPPPPLAAGDGVAA